MAASARIRLRRDMRPLSRDGMTLCESLLFLPGVLVMKSLGKSLRTGRGRLRQDDGPVICLRTSEFYYKQVSCKVPPKSLWTKFVGCFSELARFSVKVEVVFSVLTGSFAVTNLEGM